MSEYPPGWRTRDLKDLCDIKASNIDKKSATGERPAWVCNYTDVIANRRISKKISFLRSSATPSQIDTFSLRKNDILITKDAEVGRVSIVTEEVGNLVCGYHLYQLRTKSEEVHPDFLFWALQSTDAQSYFKKEKTGTTISGLARPALEATQILIPPLNEQRKIAAALTGAERCVSANKSRIHHLETLYSSLLADCLKRLPKDCSTMQLTDACSEVFLGLTSKVDYVEKNGIPLIRASNIRNGEIDFGSARLISREQHMSLTKYRKAEKGDILVTKSGSLGECAIVESGEEFSIYESIVCLKPKTDFLLAGYLFHAMQSDAVKEQFLAGKVGSAVAHLNLNDFRKIVIPVPSLQTQALIANTLDAINAKKELLRVGTGKQMHLQDALANDLLSGRKRVSV